MTHCRTLSPAVLFGAVLFALHVCAVESQAAGNPWVYESCADWIQGHSRETFHNTMPTTVARIGTCSPERLRTACRLAATGAPVRGLELCPDELCPRIGRALIALGLAALRRGQLVTVYRLCPQQW